MYDAKATRLSLMNLTVNQFILKYDIDPATYNYTDFFNYYVNTNNIFVDNNIPVIEDRFFLGLTVRSDYSTAIFLNPKVYKRRINFSACHELTHCLFDMNYKIPSQEFFNVENKDAMYTLEEIEMEKLADAGAGVIMLPDIKALDALNSNKSFYLIADECRMSKSALFNRLLDFGIYSCGMSELTAIRAVRELQDSGKRSLFRMFLTGVHSTRGKQIIFDFENAI